MEVVLAVSRRGGHERIGAVVIGTASLLACSAFGVTDDDPPKPAADAAAPPDGGPNGTALDPGLLPDGAIAPRDARACIWVSDGFDAGWQLALPWNNSFGEGTGTFGLDSDVPHGGPYSLRFTSQASTDLTWIGHTPTGQTCPLFIDLWVRVAVPDQASELTLVKVHRTNGTPIEIRYSDGQIFVFDASESRLPRRLSADLWDHIVFEYDGANGTITLDGAGTWREAAKSMAGSIEIGMAWMAPGNGERRVWLDDVRISY